VTNGQQAPLAAQQQTRTIPVVFVGGGDPVATGLVASLPRPSGNFIGLKNPTGPTSIKSVELLKEVVPGLGRFYKSRLYPLLQRINQYLVRWAKRKYKRLRGHTRQAKRWLVRAARREPKLFPDWRLGVRPEGWTMGAV
jgi:hypothetical protein